MLRKIGFITLCFGTAILAITLAGCGGGSSGGGEEIDKTPPVITNAQVITPDDFDYPGGTVTVQANVTDNVGVASVTAKILDSATSSTTTITLTKSSGTLYSASTDINYNHAAAGDDTETFTFTISASDAAANTATASAGSVTLDPGIPGPPF